MLDNSKISENNSWYDNKNSNIFDKIIFAASTFVWIMFVLSASISVPLLWRGFYYLQINHLHLPGITGLTYEQIKEAFDEMMDFCIFNKEFGTGVLKYSEEGMQHFADCAILFRIDLIVLIVSTALIVLLTLSRLMPKKGPRKWAGIITMVSFVVISALVAIDFDKAFVIFHKLFFPGKDNWLFDPTVDQIIMILPEEFFLNCAILIVSVLFGLCAVLIFTDIKCGSDI